MKAQYDLSSLQFVVHAAAPCPPPVKRAMIEWWGPVIEEYYGATETSARGRLHLRGVAAQPGTVGKPIPEREVAHHRRGGQDPAGRGRRVSVASASPDFTYHSDDAKRRAPRRTG